ncbi:putative zinc finger protein 3-like [Capsicum annuum]|nr:putative zinc finger protein 3-like [Capsicum annuum]
MIMSRTTSISYSIRYFPIIRRHIFAAAIPGSFYGRLFPSSSIHVAYSCYALHWLSVAPKGLIDMKNKRRIHYDGASIDVWNAYFDQFEKDMGVFLSARANEMVHGGLIVVILPALPSEQYYKIGYKLFTFLESSLIDMVNEGILEEFLVDSFNLPLYFPSDEDMTKVVEKNGCFSIERMEMTCFQSTIDAKSHIRHHRAGLEKRNVADNAKLMVREAIIENLDIQTKTFVIVDMGCSVGPNTFFAMQNVVQAIKHKYHSTCSQIEFHVFFNDHVTNDFNVLFESLFSDHQKTYFAAAIPGSFYGRLFPSRSIHVAYSCYALQWLSRVPKGLIDKKNKGRIHYDGASIDVWNAYVDQFEKDMEVFLSARANEMVHGGLIVLVLPSIPSEQHSKIGYRIFTFVESSLIDMVNEGFYYPSELNFSSFLTPLALDADVAPCVKLNT